MNRQEFNIDKSRDNKGDIILPSFRLGYTLATPEKSEGLSYDEAIYFGEVFEGKHKDKEKDYFRLYLDEILPSLREYDPSVSFYKGGKEKPYVRYFQVPVINFPYFDFKFNGYRLLVRESLTTCIGVAKSKIWFSATLIPVDDHSIRTYEYKTIEEMSEQLSLIGEKMLTRFNKFYSRAITGLFGKKNPAKKDLEAQIFSFSTQENIDEDLKMILQGKKAFLKKLENDTKSPGECVTLNFLDWVSEKFKIDRNDLDLKFLTSFPRDDDDNSYGKKLSLIAQKKTGENQETYFSLGYEQNPTALPKLRFKNSEVSSRTLVVEIGRVH